jgi:hypothetical protein
VMVVGPWLTGVLLARVGATSSRVAGPSQSRQTTAVRCRREHLKTWPRLRSRDRGEAAAGTSRQGHGNQDDRPTGDRSGRRDTVTWQRWYTTGLRVLYALAVDCRARTRPRRRPVAVGRFPRSGLSSRYVRRRGGKTATRQQEVGRREVRGRGRGYAVLVADPASGAAPDAAVAYRWGSSTTARSSR